MNLARPIVFFDLEATGLDWENDRIIEIACIRLSPDGSTFKYDSLINPEREIPEVVVELTGISDDDVQDSPAFHEVAAILVDVFSGADLAGYNAANFDVPLLQQELARTGHPVPWPEDMVVLDSLEILRKNEVRTLAWTYKHYFDREFPEAHRAIKDVEVTVDILNEQLSRYNLDGTPRDIVKAMRHPYLDGRRKFMLNEENCVVVCFGKFSGKTLDQIKVEESTYIDWLLKTLDPEAQGIIRAALSIETIRTIRADEPH